MSFKLKSLAVALALVATAPAHAAMNGGFDANGSSLILGLYSATGQKSAVFDLGFNYTDLLNNGLASFTTNLTSGDYASTWNNFFTGATTQANTSWAVFAFDGQDDGAVGDVGLITTLKGSTFGSAITSTNLGDVTASVDAVITDNNTLVNHNSVANGASTSTIGGVGYLDTTFGNGVNNFYGQGSVMADSIGATQNVIQTLNTLSSQTTRSILGAGGNNSTFNLASNGALVFTQGLAAPVVAVPEADTSAMLLAGLGLIGFVARRRKQA